MNVWGRGPVTVEAQGAVRAVTSLSDAAFRAAGLASEWTVEEMLAARPMPVREVEVFGTGNSIARAAARASGPAGSIRSLARGGSAGSATIVGSATIGAEASIFDGGGYEYPAPHTRYENFPMTQAQYNQFPYRTIGRLFFTFEGIGNFVCSASSIGNYAVWTASHCVHSGGPGGVWATNFVFVPATFNGSAPYGQFTGAYAITNSAWVDGSDLRYDYASVILNPNTVGLTTRKVSQRVGSLGFAWNYDVFDPSSHWAATGYPAGPPFTGTRQIICQASFAYRDWFLFFGDGPIGIGCDQTGGTSGGPWIRQYAGTAGAANYVNGNQSYRLIVNGVLRDQELFSPYYDQTTKDIGYDCAVNSSPTVFNCVAPPAP